LIFNIDLEYVINVVAENQEKFKPNLLGWICSFIWVKMPVQTDALLVAW
jgi:hypothetical protein